MPPYGGANPSIAAIRMPAFTGDDGDGCWDGSNLSKHDDARVACDMGLVGKCDRRLTGLAGQLSRGKGASARPVPSCQPRAGLARRGLTSAACLASRPRVL